MIAFLRTLVGISVPALIPVSLGILSLYLGIKAYRRKTGAYLRGGFTPCQSRDCNDVFISEVILENLKDRAVTIFGIYLRLGYSYYLELEDFEDDGPLLLRPFETYRKGFGPIEFYGINSNKINLNDLLSNPKFKKTLFLSTSDGKYKVRSRIRRWSPIYDFFNNHLTAIVRPVRSTYKEQPLGGNTKFVVDIVKENGKSEIIPLHPTDYELKLFREFNLTRESLADKESLERFLREQQAEGKLHFKDVVVYDLQAWRARAHEFYKGETIRGEPYGLFHYFVLGRVYTIYDNWRMKRNNICISRAHRQKEVPPTPTAVGPDRQGGLIEGQEVVKGNLDSNSQSER
jgi:hypothetical protein